MQVSEGGDFDPTSLQGQYVQSIIRDLTREQCGYGLWQHFHGPLWMYPPYHGPARIQWCELVTVVALEAFKDNDDSINRATKACEKAVTRDPRTLQYKGTWTADQREWLQYEGYIDELGNVIRGIPFRRELYDSYRAESGTSRCDENGRPRLQANPVTERALSALKAMKPGLEKMYLPNGTYYTASLSLIFNRSWANSNCIIP